MFAFNCLNKQRLLSHKLGYKIGSNVKKSSLVSIEKKTFEYENTVCFEGSLRDLGKAYLLSVTPVILYVCKMCNFTDNVCGSTLIYI